MMEDNLINKSIKICKKFVILFIVTTLFFSTIVVKANSVKERMNPEFSRVIGPSFSAENEKTQATTGAIIFDQQPIPPEGAWIFRTSDAGAGYRVWDEYWEVNEVLCGIRWWGVGVDNQSNSCNPEGMVFEIVFWDGLLGSPICTYNVSPFFVSTGIFYGGLEMYMWEAELEPCCDLIPTGWVTIQSVSSPNQFMFCWASSDDGDLYCYHEGKSNPNQESDSAFELVSDWETPNSKICCDPVGPFPEKVPPGFKTTFQIYVCNCGESGSWLNWYIDEKTIPNWGNWTFWRYNGTYVAEGDCDIIDVDFIAPKEEGQYYAELRIRNKDDTSDFCSIDLFIYVTRTRTSSNLWFLERLPMMERLLNLLK